MENPLNFGNQEYIAHLYEAFLRGEEMDPSWKAFFLGYEMGDLPQNHEPQGACSPSTSDDYAENLKRYGHLFARHNPFLKEEPNPYLQGKTGDPRHKELESIFLGSIGFEYMHIDDLAVRQKIEGLIFAKDEITSEDQQRALHTLMKAKLLEEFLQNKFLGAKRFSIEGAEAFLVMLTELKKMIGQHFHEVAIAMAHRGRLNVLCHLFDKPYQELFAEFSGQSLAEGKYFSGDVKYHMGRSVHKQGEKTTWTLLSNPSHLESVDPVLLGYLRGKADLVGEDQVLGVMVHGDASIAGQGVIYEMLQMMRLEGYKSFGVLHIIINNQIGFTADASRTRSTRYPSDIAKAFGLPVFHVNGEDIEACIHTIRLAQKVRTELCLDVFIDLNCYRLYGHNEADEPRFTNPLLYKDIKNRKHPYELYKEQLHVDRKEEEEQFQDRLKDAFEKKEGFTPKIYERTDLEAISTKITDDLFTHFVEKSHTLKPQFHPHPKLQKLFEERKRAILDKPEETNIDWGAAELIAYASIVHQGNIVRLSGQDSERGTFSHRHSVVIDQEDGHRHIPLRENFTKPLFYVYNSLLSEYAVMAFEFGYSRANREALVIWEGQFGDFANGAQIVIDQFIASSETKWMEPSSLTLFLPHGMESMGPEHSSARLERFLQLSGNDNWSVVNPTRPSQLFHLLRRQILSKIKKPLIVMMPKSMLRYAPSFSTRKEFTELEFSPIYVDKGEDQHTILCSGKFYYEIRKKADEMGRKPTIIRFEQLYPFPKEAIETALSHLKEGEAIIWAQEEHQNGGAYHYIMESLDPDLLKKHPLVYRGRKPLATTATGFSKVFQKEHEEIMKELFS